MLDYERVKNWDFGEVVQELTPREAILYALGVGYGHDPLDERQLRFVYEDGLLGAPTMAATFGYPGTWFRHPSTGIDWVRVVHGEHAVRLHAPVPTSGTLAARPRVRAIVDKGAGRGAVVYLERHVVDADSGRAVASIDHVVFCRGDGGFGGGDEPPPAPPRTPERDPDRVCDLATLPQSALLYRLCGDSNPLHAVPAVAREAGFERPILHGLCTFGVAGHAILRTLCDYDPARIAALSVRFASPVYPGETIRTELWLEDGGALFRARAVERDTVVLTNGVAELR